MGGVGAVGVVVDAVVPGVGVIIAALNDGETADPRDRAYKAAPSIPAPRRMRKMKMMSARFIIRACTCQTSLEKRGSQRW